MRNREHPTSPRATHGIAPVLHKNDQGGFHLSFDLPDGQMQWGLGAGRGQ
ncbi:MAG: hypothetical protein Q8M11_22265 [Sulfuritalea sp.]|nr:hypothetical protein [Sulfuritalea sp.]